MNQSLGKALAVLCGLALSAVSVMTACAQMSDVKEKPPMYTYVAFWNIPRTQWADMDKSTASEKAALDKAIAGGTIVAYGDDHILVHTADSGTHDSWWSAMSMAGLLNVLDQFYKAGTPTSPVMASATKHWDAIFVSHYYNWHAGSWKDVYSEVAYYKMKPDVASDALENLSKNIIGPLLEKMLSDGAIHEYEIDTEAVHTEAPGSFWIAYIAANAEGVDKVNAAIRETLKSNPTFGPAFISATDASAHRDYLSRTNATYK
jgi:hypothetical protein